MSYDAPAGTDPNTGKPWRLCRLCGCPMRPEGVKKKPNEYDHARGCPHSRKRRAA